jgi:hypothetical protein
LIHLLGDAISPSIVAAGSDSVGLVLSIKLVPIAMGIGAVIWLYGWRMLPAQSTMPGER